MDAFDKVLLVANPLSGGGRAGRCVDTVRAALADGGLDCEAVLTQRQGDGEAAARDCEGERPLLVAFGGDGTFNEVLNGADLARATLAIIPAGTGNVLAKELGVPRQPARAARLLAGGRCVRMDVGVCNGRRFACVFGAGLDARIVETVHSRRGASMSKLRYLPHIVRAVVGMPPWRIRVVGGDRTLAEGVRQVIIANTRSYGGPMCPASAAGPHDGELDAMCARMDGPVNVAAAFAGALAGMLHRCGAVCYARGRRFRVEAPGQQVPYQIDGEAAGFLPAEVGIMPDGARLLVPAAYTERSPRKIAGTAAKGR